MATQSTEANRVAIPLMPVGPPKPGILTVLQWQHGDTNGEDGLMQTLTMSVAARATFIWALSFLIALSGCSGGSSDSVTVDGDVAIAYVKRPTSTLGNPTDAITLNFFCRAATKVRRSLTNLPR